MSSMYILQVSFSLKMTKFFILFFFRWLTKFFELKLDNTKSVNTSRPSSSYKDNKAFTIVTGASENHFCPMKAFIYSLNSTLVGLNARIIVYDLGMNRTQR